MSKFKKLLSACAATILCTFALASCGEATFYDDWHDAGAEIEEENCFKKVTLEEVETMIGNSKDTPFIVFMGTPTNTTSVSKVSAMQKLADNLDYDGVFYFLNTKESLSTTAKSKEARAILGVKEINPGSEGLIAACYKDGSKTPYFDTSNPNDVCERFMPDGALQVNFDALVTYTIEYYKVEK